MTIFTIVCTLAGMGLGFRFKVLAIVPAAIAVMIFGGLFSFGSSNTLSEILWFSALNLIALQVGYLCGNFAREVGGTVEALGHDPEQVVGETAQSLSQDHAAI